MSMKKVLVFVIITLIVRCDIPVSADAWPSGSYSLAKPRSGCPNFWKEGWLRQHLDDKIYGEYESKFSSNFHMDATLKNPFLERRFCTKEAKFTHTSEWKPWPKGFYCVYKKHSCPYPMVDGSIKWDNEDSSYTLGTNGYLPDYNIDLSYGVDIRLYYCCQNEGKWYKPIELPTEKPFYLLPYGSRECQRVMWAVSSLEYIIYDTEDTGNFDEFDGNHVYTDKVKSLPKIFYCYYEGCRHKLRNEDGSFSSPNFLNSSYPDFQFCSWSITVNINSRILLKFKTLNVPNCDENYLDIYDGFSAYGLTPLARLCGRNATSAVKMISRTNHLFVVLKSGNNSVRNAEKSSESVGFYAHYKAFHPAVTTATASPTTMFIDPAVTATTSSQATMFTDPTNDTIDSGRKDFQNTNNKNSAIYLSIFLPLFVILIVFGIVGGILYWKRLNKKSDAATYAQVQVEKKENQHSQRYVSHTPSTETSGPYVTTKSTTNPIYEPEVDATYESIDKDLIEMRNNATDNVIYESGSEPFKNNPIYGTEMPNNATDNIIYESGNEPFENNPIYGIDNDIS